MVVLLDINVLVALFDATHVHHDAAHDWFGAARAAGWATAPITEIGFVRVLSNPAYPGRRTTPSDARQRLALFTESGAHVFWEDALSLRDSSVFDLTRVLGHRQLTDVYLLGLAVAHGGALATFDRGIARAGVKGAGEEHLVVVGA